VRKPAWKTAFRIGLALCLLTFCASPAAAVIIYIKEQAQPVRGYFVREDDQAVTLLEVLPDGSTTERSIPRSQIDDMIRSVSEQRLSELDPSKPDAYREYAEELAEKRKDPDAQRTSIRLFQIAAILDPERLGRSCLLGMVTLARDTTEQRRFRAMAYLLDPAHDTALLQTTVQPSERTSTLDEKQAEFLLKPLRLLRQGKRKDALAQGRRCKLEERLPLLTDTITYLDFEKACRPTCPECDRGRQTCSNCGGTRSVAGSGGANVPCAACGGSGEIPCTTCHGNFRSPPLPPSLLRRILEVEAQWLPAVTESSEESGPGGSPLWSHAAQREQTAPAHALTLDTLTEFNPRHNRYVDGNWTE
jgi:hypothetical protein